MQHVTIDWFRLLRYSLLFLVFSTLVAMFTVFWFSENLQDAWHKGLMLSVTELEMTLELSLTLFIYVSFPILLFRFMYYFSKMLYRGRKDGVAIISYKTLFNPLNFLLFPSLLNDDGLLFRRRCILALIMMILTYIIIIIIT